MCVNHNGSFAWLPYFLIYDHLYFGGVVCSLFTHIYTHFHQNFSQKNETEHYSKKSQSLYQIELANF